MMIDHQVLQVFSGKPSPFHQGDDRLIDCVDGWPSNVCVRDMIRSDNAALGSAPNPGRFLPESAGRWPSLFWKEARSHFLDSTGRYGKVHLISFNYIIMMESYFNYLFNVINHIFMEK